MAGPSLMGSANWLCWCWPTRQPFTRIGLDPVRSIQVLCPMNRGGVGARSLNIELQAALNPTGDRKVERFGWTFAPGDKVMQIAWGTASSPVR